MVRIILIFLISLGAAINLSRIEGRVTDVIDGNTLEITKADGQVYRVVLLEIDCPELNQEYGPESRELLHKLTMNSEVIVHLHGKDRLRNYIGIVVIEELGDVRLLLLQEGLAWTSEKDPSPDLEIIRAEAMARKAGLWKSEHPVAPWIFRREQSMLDAKSR